MKKSILKMISAALAAVLLLTAFPAGVCAFAEGDYPYRTLKKDDTGADVLMLKERMYYLGYFNTLNLSDQYNNTMIKRIKMLQKNNGLEETGIATPELQELIYSDACVWQGPTPKPTPVPTPAPTPIAPHDTVALPETGEDGFLISGDPFVYANPDEGHWVYISTDISIEIIRYTQKKPALIWFETHILLKDGVRLQSLLVPGKQKTTFKQPGDIIEQYTDDSHTVVLAFSDDFFAYRRKYEGTRIGIIVRDREIMSETTAGANSTKFPPLDIMAVFPDGTLKTYGRVDHTAQEYLDMGVIDTYAFGPILTQNGRINPYIYGYDKFDMEPRTALGMIAPGEYIVLTVTGRRDDSKGASFIWLAEKMNEKGAVESINLDGGNTCSLLFMGKIINRPANTKSKDIRYVSGLIGVIEETAP
ncbi:MAG: hypothetical protein CW338_03925 [Clostridiales bacterium]|nr:hypothetical protein [Clostridiales bacterium]